MVDFSNLKIGKYYNRKGLATLWGYKAHQALSRGVVTPANTRTIVLFVTMEKQSSSIQYSDYISDNYLYWEGEEKGVNNRRIIESGNNRDIIHLFYRHRHHQDFEYKGLVELQTFIPSEDAPFKFVFKINGNEQINLNNALGYIPLDIDKPTERKSLQLSRVGQGEFRINLMKLWTSCSVSAVNFPEILRASHIKPWKDSNNQDRLNPYNGLLLTPTYDLLFDKGYISFQNNGQMLLSKQVQSFKELLHISNEMKLRTVHSDNLTFLEYHRDVLFDK